MNKQKAQFLKQFLYVVITPIVVVVKILVISDVVEWNGYKEIVNKVEPHVVVLAGDLTSDGFACFWWSEWFEKNMPGFLEDEMELIKKFGNKFDAEMLHSLKEKYMNTEDFHVKRRKTHVDEFYQFLEYAGGKTQVLVIKGDHDGFRKRLQPGKNKQNTRVQGNIRQVR